MQEPHNIMLVMSKSSPCQTSRVRESMKTHALLKRACAVSKWSLGMRGFLPAHARRVLTIIAALEPYPKECSAYFLEEPCRNEARAPTDGINVGVCAKSLVGHF